MTMSCRKVFNLTRFVSSNVTSQLNRRTYCLFPSAVKTNLAAKSSEQNIASKKVDVRVRPLDDLKKPLSDINIKYSSANQSTDTLSVSDIHTSTLNDGLKVVTVENFSNFVTFGVAISSGSRYEEAYKQGISQLLQKLAFHSTRSFSGQDVIIEQIKGIFDCVSQRNYIIYGFSVSPDNIDVAMDILGEVIFLPNFSEEEINMAKSFADAENDFFNLNQDMPKKMEELLHEVAFKDNTLGLPFRASRDSLQHIHKEDIVSFVKDNHYNPHHMALIGVGVDGHDKFVNLIKEKFMSKYETARQEMNLEPRSAESRFEQNSIYTGGQRLIEEDMSNISLGPNPLPDLAHLAVGFRSPAQSAPDYVTACLLQMLFGGGGSFSAGGPGKGMYSKFYRDVLNRHHEVYHFQAYNMAYADNGLFWMYGSIPPKSLSKLLAIMATITQQMSAGLNISTEEFERARSQLKSMMFMNLEHNAVLFESIGQEIVMRMANSNDENATKTAKENLIEKYCTRIEAIEKDELVEFARQLATSSVPSIVAYGNLSKLPRSKPLSRMDQSVL